MPALTRHVRLQHAASAARARAVLWLALLALTLRALVPAGYMPDTRALHDGRLEVTFCSAAGALPSFVLALPAGGKEQAGHDTAGSGAQCPFGLLAHVLPAPAADPPPLVLATVRHAPPKPAPGALPSQNAHGPPLGSRAPPALA
ncbi:DUF2946 family protein [Achromobacter denitrificans]|uniref:DUF2946 family protein n=2 Tax=Achromobacter denitrificans TaxID=32002 RepID=UPI00146978AE|nr:DUF2946 family protein [Achromobacter denitrificans]MBV2162065.1 DUF2946 family protein [Achromobacter denitrificans]CAB3904105.1 hypothetical protein LMG1860_05502 [Achromobacter denitrificans]